ncbi:MAG TPA: hypothetical protein VEB86_00680 [Chryseosolibacter sp.]|nr:hypothetical protein [Chryseosolibacter sp.]
MRIRCPKCNWEPDGGEYWKCHCGCTWNTFDTAAKCPDCGFQHQLTQCPGPVGGCNAFSFHLDWYEDLDNTIEEALKTTIVSDPPPARK